MEATAKKKGRPKMPEHLKKWGFSMKVSPELRAKIEPLKNRNEKIEAILKKNISKLL